MKNPYIFFTICFIVGLLGAIYLVMHNHPAFAFLILLVVGSLSFKGEANHENDD